MTRQLLATAALFAGVVAAVPVAAQQALTWASGGPGSRWHAIATGMAELLREKAQLTIKIVPGNEVQNPGLVQKGEADLGMGLSPLLQVAKMPELRGLAGNMSVNAFHFYVADGSPYASMSLEEIVKGKKPIRLAISNAGAADVWVFERVMEFYGLCAADKTEACYRTWEAAGAKFVRASAAEQADAFRNRIVDGTFTFAALPGAAVTEASVGRRLKLLRFPEPLLAHLAKLGVGKGTIPAGTYPQAANASEPVVSASMGTTITVHASMAPALAYTITKTLNDNADRVRKIHGSLADYDASKAHLLLGVPLHAGAERYYREKGYLN